MKGTVLASGVIGFVREWQDARGFGYLESDGGANRVFCHARVLPKARARDPIVGERAQWDVVQQPDGRIWAENVALPDCPEPRPGILARNVAGSVAKWTFDAGQIEVTDQDGMMSERVDLCAVRLVEATTQLVKLKQSLGLLPLAPRPAATPSTVKRQGDAERLQVLREMREALKGGETPPVRVVTEPIPQVSDRSQ
jgi:cold shock CspA family protein